MKTERELLFHDFVVCVSGNSAVKDIFSKANLVIGLPEDASVFFA